MGPIYLWGYKIKELRNIVLKKCLYLTKQKNPKEELGVRYISTASFDLLQFNNNFKLKE